MRRNDARENGKAGERNGARMVLEVQGARNNYRRKTTEAYSDADNILVIRDNSSYEVHKWCVWHRTRYVVCQIYDS